MTQARRKAPENKTQHSQRSESVRHLAFFVAAAETPEASTEYAELMAGVMVLRLADKLQRPSDRRVRTSEVEAVRRLVSSLSDGSVRQVLQALVSSFTGFAASSAGERIDAMVTYASLLEREGHWAPSADVYETAVEIICVEKRRRERLPFCHQRAGYCYRELGAIDKAEESFRTGQSIAEARKDREWQLRLAISLVHLELHRGNIPAAERQLDLIVEEARAASLPNVVARASHDRGHVAYTRQHYEQAAALFYAAMELYDESSLRLRAMHDLATVLCDMGCVAHAARVLRIVRESTLADSALRSMAGLNLLRLAALDRSEADFERLRVELVGEPMPGRLRAHFHSILGRGLLAFDQQAGGRAELMEAVKLARQHRLNQLLIEAEGLLDAAALPVQDTVEPCTPPCTVGAILSAIDERRGVFEGAASAGRPLDVSRS